MSRIPVLSVATLLLSGACAEGPTAPSEFAPSENFANGPEEAGNVIRFPTNNADFIIRDFGRQLALTVGKEAFSDGDLCDFLPTDGLTLQQVGFGDAISHTLGRAEDWNLSLFRVTMPPCGAELLAKGTGTARRVNHQSEREGRPEPFSASVRGVLEGVDEGERWRVQAIVTAVHGERVVSEIRLRPLAGNGGLP